MKKYPVFNAFLSFFVTGLGQILNGQIVKGLILVCSRFLFLPLFLISSSALFWIVFVVSLVIKLYSISDAYEVAEKINKGEKLNDWFGQPLRA